MGTAASAGAFRDIYTDFGTLSMLRRQSRSDAAPEALKTVARQFEGLFLQMMLKSMRDAGPGNPLFDSDRMDLYRDMLDKQVAGDIAQSRSLGMADMLVTQLQGYVRPAAVAVHAPARAPGAVADPSNGSEMRMPLPRTPHFDSPAAFIDAMLPAAREAADRHGLDPHLLVAQAALETGWGSALMQRRDGRSAYNLFGIKADDRWPGDSTLVDTLEYADGVATRERAAFRAYASFAESFDDYIEFLAGNPRYANALAKAQDPSAYMNELQAAGYATDPRYAEKVLRILREEVHPYVAGVATQVL